jgi:hypothetical protein
MKLTLTARDGIIKASGKAAVPIDGLVGVLDRARTAVSVIGERIHLLQVIFDLDAVWSWYVSNGNDEGDDAACRRGRASVSLVRWVEQAGVTQEVGERTRRVDVWARGALNGSQNLAEVTCPGIREERAEGSSLVNPGRAAPRSCSDDLASDLFVSICFSARCVGPIVAARGARQCAKSRCLASGGGRWFGCCRS